MNGPGLNDVDLALHVRPFDVLIAIAENAFDVERGTHQTAYHIISQHNAVASYRDFFHPAFSSNVSRLSSAERVNTCTAFVRGRKMICSAIR